MKRLLQICSIFLFIIICSNVKAVETPPEKPGNDSTHEKSTNNSEWEYKAEYEFKTETNESNKEYICKEAYKNVIAASLANISLDNITVNKTGDATKEDADFYGTNAAIIAYNNGEISIINGNIKTNGSHANAVFAYQLGKIYISQSKIVTSSNNSGGIMVTGGGEINATDLTVETSGSSSAAIRSDRGGGIINVTGGSYTTTGIGSPVIYSTANINVTEATLTATSSEGVVIEGNNSVTLDKVKLTDTNNKLNGNSETYKNIFIYQSASGDASEGIATFTSSNSDITTNNGDTIYVTNTKCIINLENNKITNQSGNFLKAEGAKWGTSGSNGGNITLNLNNQEVEGNIVLDKISTLSLNLKNNSYLSTAINKDNEAGKITVNLTSDSILNLTDDSYIYELINEDETNENINLNGHNLYIENQSNSSNENQETNTNNFDTLKIKIYVGIILLLIVFIIILLIKRKKKK